MAEIKFIDLFCGIGGFHYAMQNASKKLKLKSKCVFSSDIDPEAQEAYFENLKHRPKGDITKINAEDIPDHDILLAGFPCQAFSIIGDRKGFEDTRGTLFFDIARILKAKRPSGFVLENVKQLKGHNSGKTLSIILNTLHDLGYQTSFNILNALDFGLPQKRERIFIVGWKNELVFDWKFQVQKMTPLEDLLEYNVPNQYFVSEHILKKRQKNVKKFQLRNDARTIWHENKSGNISVYPFSCALRAGASYNYLLVDGQRRLTGREMLNLQGFPGSFKIIHSYGAIRRFAGNALPIPMAAAIIQRLLKLNYSSEPLNVGTKTSSSHKNITSLSVK